VNDHPHFCDCLDCMNRGGATKPVRPPTVRPAPPLRSPFRPQLNAELLGRVYAQLMRRRQARSAAA
jgi:hypothetical protein